MGELPGRNVAKTGKGKNWKSRGRGKEKNMVVEYIPLVTWHTHLEAMNKSDKLRKELSW